MPNQKQDSTKADICLLLEGTFPYVRGGVSSWVKQLIEGLPHYRFSIVYLGADRDSAKEYAYEIPKNVVHIETHYLMENLKPETSTVTIGGKLKGWTAKYVKRRRCKDAFRHSDALHSDLCAGGALSPDLVESFTRLLCGSGALSAEDLEKHPLSWQSITRQYHNAPEGLDFNHYFWTVLNMHAPIFRLARIASQAPAAHMYHSVSTGYAGFLGGLMKNIHDVPYIISEHGIYTKERELDLAQVDWILEANDPFKVGLDDNMSYLRQVWIRFFASLGRMAYSSSEEVFTLYKGNRERQIVDGADPDRLTIIPNGVNVTRYAAGRRAADAAIPPV
ncbi:MAG: GT4 family glycosyltransferase PelF, partial [Granulosicoccus sp.]